MISDNFWGSPLVQFSKFNNFFGYVDFYAKIFLILFPWSWTGNSILAILCGQTWPWAENWLYNVIKTVEFPDKGRWRGAGTIVASQLVNSDDKRRFMYPNRPSKLHQLPFDQGFKIVIPPRSPASVPEPLERHLMVFYIDPNDLALLFIMSIYWGLVVTVNNIWL